MKPTQGLVAAATYIATALAVAVLAAGEAVSLDLSATAALGIIIASQLSLALSLLALQPFRRAVDTATRRRIVPNPGLVDDMYEAPTVNAVLLLHEAAAVALEPILGAWAVAAAVAGLAAQIVSTAIQVSAAAMLERLAVRARAEELREARGNA